MCPQPASMQAGSMIFNDVTVRGFWLVNWFERASKEERMAIYGDLTRMVLAGELFALNDRHFGLEEVKEAAACMWAGECKGKVLLAPNGV